MGGSRSHESCVDFYNSLVFTSKCILIIRKVKHTANGFSTHDVTLQPFLLEEEVPFELT